eukprot:TRINITY_DN10294_c0_g1_i1.p1 TRINITY_DN10294_c0_g1~~TRINITY_DN10294_c0_g1_i1.p1  ORF type:complete len:519 (-),score=78.47 TRINITY_DN10294_c0_g1_i1:574-2130(-)
MALKIQSPSSVSNSFSIQSDVFPPRHIPTICLERLFRSSFLKKLPRSFHPSGSFYLCEAEKEGNLCTSKGYQALLSVSSSPSLLRATSVHSSPCSPVSLSDGHSPRPRTLHVERYGAFASRPVRRTVCKATAVEVEASQKAMPGEMMTNVPYTPPEWAKHLSPIPEKVFRLGHYPTPIHQWHVPGLPAGTCLFIKRDDLTGMQLSGNKVRKLEFLLADAKKNGADCVITIGGIQSNHCRATAVAARYAGLEPFLVLRTNKSLVGQDPGLVGNLLVERLVGAQIRLVSKEDYLQLGSESVVAILEEQLKAEGRRPYVVPLGGSNSLGSWGYVEAVRELEQQLQNGEAGGATAFDDIVMACGSGGTTAGIGLASHLSSVKAKVHGFGVCDDQDYFYTFIQGLLDGMNCGLQVRDLVTMVDAKGTGYAMSTSEELAFVRQVAEATGVILDPVYSGKAVKGLLRDMADNPGKWEGRTVLFVHTGGLLGMYDKSTQLQPMLAGWEPLQVPTGTVEKAKMGRMF